MRVSRREFAAGSLAGFSMLAGCAGLTRPPEVAVTKIKGINLDSALHTLRVVLSDGGRVVHSSSHELAAGGSSDESFVVAEALPESTGAYTLAATLDGDTMEEIDLAAEYGGSRLRVIVEVDERARLTFFVNREPL